VGQYCTHVAWKNTYERSSLSLDEESGTGLGGFTLRLKIKIKAISLRKEVLTVYCNKNRIYVFLFWELRGLSPNIHIHVTVSDLYILRIGPHISFSRIGRSIVGIYK
jgi:hypothetical protein